MCESPSPDITVQYNPFVCAASPFSVCISIDAISLELAYCIRTVISIQLYVPIDLPNLTISSYHLHES